jgi:hypothetical protein
LKYKFHYLHWHRKFLKVCECSRNIRKPTKWTLDGPKNSQMLVSALTPKIPESLRSSQNQSETLEDPVEVKNVICIGTKYFRKSSSAK